jgi:hypothetical protein
MESETVLITSVQAGTTRSRKYKYKLANMCLNLSWWQMTALVQQLWFRAVYRRYQVRSSGRLLFTLQTFIQEVAYAV